MSFEIAFENQGRGVVITWKGRVTGKEMQCANEAIYAQDPNSILKYRIWDYSNADSIEASADELREIAFQDYAVSSFSPGQISAIVVTPQLWVDMDHLYKTYANIWTGIKLKAFLSILDARKWVAEVIDPRENGLPNKSLH